MLKLGIIGAGTVFKNQISALANNTDHYKIVCILDSDRPQLVKAHKLLRDLGANQEVSFCSSFSEFIACDIDTVLISTPPHTHFQLAFDTLSMGKNVLLEKPAVLSIDELELLYKQAGKTGTILHVAYHAAFSVEVEWYLENQVSLANEYGLKKIRDIFCGFYDPYLIDGTMLPTKEKLGGSYIDSGVNALSVCDKILPIRNFSTMNHTEHKYDNETVISSHTVFSDGQVSLHIDTGWIYGINRKMTVIQFENCVYQLLFDHTGQRILIQPTATTERILQRFREREEIPSSESDLVLFEDTAIPRLNRQYTGVFAEFNDITAQSANVEKSIRIHKLLLKNSIK